MVALLIADSFNRADNPTSLGSTDGSGTSDPVAWSQDIGTWGINTNKAFHTATLVVGAATVQSGHSNVDVRATFGSSVSGVGGGLLGVVLRFIDSNNYLSVYCNSSGSVTIEKRVAGVSTSLIVFGSAAFTTSDVMRVTVINNLITVYKNGVVLGNIVDSALRSGTRVGLYSNHTNLLMDVFEVYTVDAPAELATDSFNRLDGAIGSTDGVGSLDPVAWTGLSGFMARVVSNQANAAASPTISISPLGVAKTCVINYIDAGTPDVQIYQKFVNWDSAGANGVVFRLVDVDNYYLLWVFANSNIQLFKRVGSVWITASSAMTSPGVSKYYGIKLSGSTITVHSNGVDIFTMVDTDLESATKHGIMLTNHATEIIDNFQMWAGEPAVPVVAQVGPTEGEAAGGTDVTIAGNNFTGATAVLFGSTPATSFTVISDGYIEATSPAHSIGLTDITVVNADGSSALVNTDHFLYFIPKPVVSSVTPNHGVPAGGTSVVITGAYFTGTTSVKFGTTEASSFTVDNDGQITATTPAHAAGVAPVIITTPYGTNG